MDGGEACERMGNSKFHHVLAMCEEMGWHSCLPFMLKFFISRVMVRGLPIVIAFKKMNIGYGLCFFCTLSLEHSNHHCITCLSLYLFGH